MLASILGGCVASFVYDRLDVAASWYAASYVSLDKIQDRQLRTVVADTLEWHRRNQFAGYTRLLNQLDADSRGPLSVELIRLRFQEMSDCWDAFVHELSPRALPMLKTLRTEQVNEFFVNLERKNLEYVDEYGEASAGERLTRRQRTAIRTIQRFTGALGESQRMLIRSRVAELHDLTAEWLAHRRTWQAHLRTLMGQPGASPEFGRDLEALLLDGNQFDDAVYRSQVVANQEQIFVMLADLSNTLTPRQRQHLGEKIRSYAAMLEDIGRRPAVPAARSAGEVSLPRGDLHTTSAEPEGQGRGSPRRKNGRRTSSLVAVGRQEWQARCRRVTNAGAEERT